MEIKKTRHLYLGGESMSGQIVNLNIESNELDWDRHQDNIQEALNTLQALKYQQKQNYNVSYDLNENGRVFSLTGYFSKKDLITDESINDIEEVIEKAMLQIKGILEKDEKLNQ